MKHHQHYDKSRHARQLRYCQDDINVALSSWLKSVVIIWCFNQTVCIHSKINRKNKINKGFLNDMMLFVYDLGKILMFLSKNKNLFLAFPWIWTNRNLNWKLLLVRERNVPEISTCRLVINTQFLLAFLQK